MKGVKFILQLFYIFNRDESYFYVTRECAPDQIGESATIKLYLQSTALKATWVNKWKNRARFPVGWPDCAWWRYYLGWSICTRGESFIVTWSQRTFSSTGKATFRYATSGWPKSSRPVPICYSNDAERYLTWRQVRGVSADDFVNVQFTASRCLKTELLNSTKYGYSFPVDYWALGCILFELLSGVSPFRVFTNTHPIDNYFIEYNILFEPAPCIDIEANASTIDLLERFLEKTPNRRIGFAGIAEIKAHPFFKFDQSQSSVWIHLATVWRCLFRNINWEYAKYRRYRLFGQQIEDTENIDTATEVSEDTVQSFDSR